MMFAARDSKGNGTKGRSLLVAVGFLFSFLCGLFVQVNLSSFKDGQSHRTLREADSEEVNNVIDLSVRSEEFPESNMKLVLDMEGFDRITLEEDEDGVTEEYLILYLENSDYHSVRILFFAYLMYPPAAPLSPSI